MSCCAACGWKIEFEKTEFRLPPWCPQCGGDLKLAQKQPALRVPQRSAVAVAAPPAESFTPTPAPSAPPRRAKLSSDGCEEPTMPDGYLLTGAGDDLRTGMTELRNHARGATFVGVGFLLLATWLAYGSMEKLWWWKPTMGTVREITHHTTRRSRSASTSEFIYSVGGKTYKAGRWWDVNLEPHKIGDNVVVLHSPTDPSEGMVKSFSNLWAWPILTYLVAGLVFLMGWSSAAMLKMVKKQEARSQAEAT